MLNKILCSFIVLIAWLTIVNVHAGNTDATCGQLELPPIHIKHLVLRQSSAMLRQLTEEQQRQLRMLREENKQELQIQHEALRENHRQMDELITSGTYTKENAAQLAQQQGGITAKMAEIEAAEMAKLYAMLTPEQQQKFSEIQSQNQVWCW